MADYQAKYREKNRLRLADDDKQRRSAMTGKPVMAMSPVFGIMMATDPPKEDRPLVVPGPIEAAELRGDPQLLQRVLGNVELNKAMLAAGMPVEHRVEMALSRMNKTTR